MFVSGYHSTRAAMLVPSTTAAIATAAMASGADHVRRELATAAGRRTHGRRHSIRAHSTSSTYVTSCGKNSGSISR